MPIFNCKKAGFQPQPHSKNRRSYRKDLGFRAVPRSDLKKKMVQLRRNKFRTRYQKAGLLGPQAGPRGPPYGRGLKIVLSAEMVYFCKTNLPKKNRLEFHYKLHKLCSRMGKKVYTAPVLNTEKKKCEKNTKN